MATTTDTTTPTNPLAAKKLLTVTEVAAYLGVSVSQAYRWAADGILPGICFINGTRYVVRAEVDAWIAAKVVDSTADSSSWRPRGDVIARLTRKQTNVGTKG